MVPVCDKRYHIYNRLRHFWAEIKKLWNYPLGIFSEIELKKTLGSVWLVETYNFFSTPNNTQRTAGKNSQQ